MSVAILIKPHHFVDIVRALANGQVAWQPHHYGHHLHEVAGRIVADRSATLQMELGADDICGPCIHNLGGQCRDVIDTSFRPQVPRSKQEWNLLIDRRWCRTLGLAVGDRIDGRQLCERLQKQLAQLPEIYRELPPEHLANRIEELQRGIETYLSDV